MSLVEDVLDVLHMVLEYFGVPPDMVKSTDTLMSLIVQLGSRVVLGQEKVLYLIPFELTD